MLRNLSLAWRMSLLLLLGGGCILGAVLGFSYTSSRNLLEKELEDEARETAQAIACQVESVAKALEQTAKGRLMPSGVSLRVPRASSAFWRRA